MALPMPEVVWVNTYKNTVYETWHLMFVFSFSSGIIFAFNVFFV